MIKILGHGRKERLYEPGFGEILPQFSIAMAKKGGTSNVTPLNLPVTPWVRRIVIDSFEHAVISWGAKYGEK